MGQPTFWQRIGAALDQYGRWQTLVAILGVIGAVFGVAWAVIRGLWGALPVLSQWVLAISFTLLLVAGVAELGKRLRQWWRLRHFPLVVAPWVRPHKLELLIINRDKSDEFKAVLDGSLYLHLDDYPRTLLWRDARTEYRTIYGTASEVLEFFEYELEKPGIGLPPEVRITLPSPIAEPLVRVIEVGDYERLRDEQFGGEIGRAERHFTIGLVGRETPVKVFDLKVRFSWFSAGPFYYEIFAEITPAISPMMGVSLDRRIRESFFKADRSVQPTPEQTALGL